MAFTAWKTSILYTYSSLNLDRWGRNLENNILNFQLSTSNDELALLKKEPQLYILKHVVQN